MLEGNRHRELFNSRDANRQLALPPGRVDRVDMSEQSEVANPLSDLEMGRLRTYKGIYALYRDGFTLDQAKHLAFIQKLHLEGKIDH